MLCDGNLGIHCMCIHSGSHLWVVDWSSSSKWYIWFLQWWWLLFHSDVVGGRWGIHGVFSSGKWVNWQLVVIMVLFWHSRCRCRVLKCRYRRLYQCWSQSRCRLFGCCQSVCDRVGVASLLCLSLNSWCWFTSTQGKQFFFEGLDMLFQGEPENTYCQVG